MCGATNDEYQRGLLDVISGIIDEIGSMLDPDDDDTTEEEIVQNVPTTTTTTTKPPKTHDDLSSELETSEVESDEMPPEPKSIKLQFVLYAVKSKVTLHHCTDVSNKKSLYKKKKKLLLHIKGKKQKSGKKLPWSTVDELNPDKRNFINIAYVKGKYKRVPIKKAAIIVMYFLKCLKKEKANLHDIEFAGGKVARKIFKFYKKHKHWLKK